MKIVVSTENSLSVGYSVIYAGIQFIFAAEAAHEKRTKTRCA